jgi:hypothetical protein
MERVATKMTDTTTSSKYLFIKEQYHGRIY